MEQLEETMPLPEQIQVVKETLKEMLVKPNEPLDNIKMTTDELARLLNQLPDEEGEKILKQAEEFIELREQA